MLSPAEHRAGFHLQPPPFLGERRRRVRHKVRTSSYVGLGSSMPGILLGPNDISDISEEGMSFQTSSMVEVGEVRPLSLHLLETGTSVMVSGRIVWSGALRRKGVEFVEMQSQQVRQIKEWLFVNFLAGCSQEPVPELTQADPAPEIEEPGRDEEAPREAAEPPAISDYTASLAAVEAVKSEAESLQFQVDSALQLVAERAQSLTRATGAAIALSGGDYLICRATSGEAPGLGALFNVGSGFSGECVRSGQLLCCQDAEIDLRVNRENCRALGVRSLIAAPVRSGDQVFGILEVFASGADAFSNADQVVLQRLTEIVAATIERANQATMTNPEWDGNASEGDAQSMDAELMEMSAAPGTSRVRRIAGIATAVALVLVLVFLVIPRLEQGSSTSAHASSASVQVPRPVAESGPTPGDIEDIRRLAEGGDPGAQFSLGARYALGDGTKRDYSEAARWFTMAAEQGNVAAQSTLGAYYASGTGVSKDLSKAYFWMMLARAGGDEPSRLQLPDLASRMPRQESAAVEQQADQWIRKHRLGGRRSQDSP
jgi:putative methionine-R-sulfoxide reductase with GAF domain